jgi:hypothetical protein
MELQEIARSIVGHLEQAWNAADGVMLVHAAGTLRVPGGPFAGEHRATQSIVLVDTNDGWKIANFHNMLAASRG